MRFEVVAGKCNGCRDERLRMTATMAMRPPHDAEAAG
jgi:hypothetical protein